MNKTYSSDQLFTGRWTINRWVIVPAELPLQLLQQVRRNRGGTGGLQAPLSLKKNFAKFYFYELKKTVLKWKIVQSYKTSWNSSKVIDIYSITIELNKRDGLFCQ